MKRLVLVLFAAMLLFVAAVPVALAVDPPASNSAPPPIACEHIKTHVAVTLPDFLC